MAGLLIAILLVASLLLVHFSVRSRPMPKRRPLNVDVGLPLPEAGQASTVFSLTALFGAYFGIYLVLGLPALAGLAFGTTIGLLLIRKWIRLQNAPTFESFLLRVLHGTNSNSVIFGFGLCAVQCAFATSELLILREIARVSLGLRSDHATLLVVALAVIGYFYILFGGYMAVFRTDVLQFVLIAVMAVALIVVAFQHGVPNEWVSRFRPRPGYWELPVGHSDAFLYVYHFVIGTVMGLGFLAVSPDAWKRVFVVANARGSTPRRFFIFLMAGIAPFMVLLLFGIPTAPLPDGVVNAGQMFSVLLTSNFLFVAAALGLVASFLSSFDSALLAAVHVGIILQRKKRRVGIETPRLHWLMVTALISIFFLFTGLVSFQNPYILANVLLGAYAIIAGLEIGTGGMVTRLPDNGVLWFFAVGSVAWLLYFYSKVGLPSVPTTYQINTVPGGVLLCVATALVSQLLIIGGRKNVRT